jgi:hypothetical protein
MNFYEFSAKASWFLMDFTSSQSWRQIKERENGSIFFTISKLNAQAFHPSVQMAAVDTHLFGGL